VVGSACRNGSDQGKVAVLRIMKGGDKIKDRSALPANRFYGRSRLKTSRTKAGSRTDRALTAGP